MMRTRAGFCVLLLKNLLEPGSPAFSSWRGATFSLHSVSSMCSTLRFAEPLARSSLLDSSSRWIGRLTVSAARQRSARSLRLSVMFSRIHRTSRRNGRNRWSRPQYPRALPLHCGTQNVGHAWLIKQTAPAGALSTGDPTAAPPSAATNFRLSPSPSTGASASAQNRLLQHNRPKGAISTGSNASRIALGLPANLWRAEMRRREFIAGLGSVVLWPAVLRAQQRERVRRIGVLIHLSENQPAGQRYVATFRQ